MKLVNIKIKYGGQIMTYECGDLSLSLGDWVVVKNKDLTYLGQVVMTPVLSCPPPEKNEEGDENLCEPSCPLLALEDPPFTDRELLRVASNADLARQAENEVREQEAFEYCLARVQLQGLNMKLVAVEALFDGSKTIFYYTAEDRVDFRQLVKELVNRFRTRIEMRQIGIRQEARMLGGLGNCGRNFCCSGFLANFAPVSVKIAKEQNISLSPSKISGACGRLMCCLAFEHYGPESCPKNNKARYPDDENFNDGGAKQ